MHAHLSVIASNEQKSIACECWRKDTQMTKLSSLTQKRRKKKKTRWHAFLFSHWNIRLNVCSFVDSCKHNHYTSNWITDDNK